MNFQEPQPVAIVVRGTIVSAHPRVDGYPLELFDRDGNTIDLIECSSPVFVVVEGDE